MSITFATSAVIIAAALFFAMTHYRATLAARFAKWSKERAKKKGKDPKVSMNNYYKKWSGLRSTGWHQKRGHSKDTEIGTEMEMY